MPQDQAVGAVVRSLSEPGFSPGDPGEDVQQALGGPWSLHGQVGSQKIQGGL